jgi:hypothetical protein
MRVLFCVAAICSAGLCPVLAQAISPYRTVQSVPACRSRETIEAFTKIEGSGNRAAKLRADLLRVPLVRAECHVLPVGIEVYVDESAGGSARSVCVRLKDQSECAWTMPSALQKR